MGSITIQIVGDASVGTRTKSWSVTDAEINRLVAYCKASYPVTNPDGTQSPPTVAQAVLAWAQGFLEGTSANVQRFETPPPVVPPPITASP